jgi:GNAT superfamily N-acetyltransferase
MNIEVRRLEYDEIVNELFPKFKMFYKVWQAQDKPDVNEVSDQRIIENISERDKESYRFAAFEDGNIVGCFTSGKLKPDHPEYAIRKHISWLAGFVLPQYRRQGIGSRLAKKALEMASLNGVKVVDSSAHNDFGEAFLLKLGGKVASASSDRMLDLSKLCWDMIKKWLQTPVTNLKLEYYPEMSEEFIERTIDISYASTLETKIMDNCEVPPIKEGELYSLREYSQFLKNTSTSYHCLLLTDHKGEIVGFTEGTVSPEKPNVFNQGMTMVWKHHRGNGYGKFLKASMLDFVKKNQPAVTQINTSNNDLNASMLAINIKLGFELLKQVKVYRLDVRKALGNLKM